MQNSISRREDGLSEDSKSSDSWDRDPPPVPSTSIEFIEGYIVTADGRVYSKKSNKYLSLWPNNKGRLLVTLCIEGKNKHYLISRLVAYCFGLLSCLDSDLEVDHIDTNPTNNNIKNLQALSKEDHLDKTLSDKGWSRRLPSLPRELKYKDITAEEIEYWVTNFSWVRAGKELGLSDNGLRKRYKLLTGKCPKTIK